MRLLSCSIVALCLIGCESVPTRAPDATVAEAHLPGARQFVAVPRLARNLRLDYHGEDKGLIEMATPPDHVMLIAESDRALVNGEQVALDHPCVRRGEEFVLAADDAKRLTSYLVRLRSAREEAARRAKAAADDLARKQRAETRKPRRMPLPPEWEPQGLSRPWRYIVIHHQAAARGDASLIHQVHLRRGMDGLGYHFVVGNGTLSGDGEVEVGYRWVAQIHGAHARVNPADANIWNRFGIGICLVGDFRKTEPTEAQIDALVRLVRRLRFAYGIPADRVVPHDFVKPTICPGPKFPWAEFHARIR